MDFELRAAAHAELVVIAHKLRALRKAAGLTQAELADILGVTHTTICAREKGRKSMDTVDFIAHAAALGARTVLEHLDD